MNGPRVLTPREVRRRELDGWPKVALRREAAKTSWGPQFDRWSKLEYINAVLNAEFGRVVA